MRIHQQFSKIEQLPEKTWRGQGNSSPTGQEEGAFNNKVMSEKNVCEGRTVTTKKCDIWARKHKISVSSAVMAESQRSFWRASPHAQHQTRKTLTNGWKTGLCYSKKECEESSQLWFLCKRLYFRRIILREDHITQLLPQIGDSL